MEECKKGKIDLKVGMLKCVGASNLFLLEQQYFSHVCWEIEWARSSEIKEISHEVLSRFHHTHSHTLRAC